MKIAPQEALAHLAEQSEKFVPLFQHGSLSVEIYKPEGRDLQTPHTRDEVYVVVAGQGQFFNDGETVDFGPGDFLFVKAGKEHRFLNFSEDFSTWVLFYGPEGGE